MWASQAATVPRADAESGPIEPWAAPLLGRNRLPGVALVKRSDVAGWNNHQTPRSSRCGPGRLTSLRAAPSRFAAPRRMLLPAEPIRAWPSARLLLEVLEM